MAAWVVFIGSSLLLSGFVLLVLRYPPTRRHALAGSRLASCFLIMILLADSLHLPSLNPQGSIAAAPSNIPGATPALTSTPFTSPTATLLVHPPPSRRPPPAVLPPP